MTRDVTRGELCLATWSSSASPAPSRQTSAITEGEPVGSRWHGLAPKGELNRGVPRWPGSPSSVRDTWFRAAGRAFRAPRVPSDDRAGQGRPSAPGTVRARFQGGRTARTNRAKLVSRSEVALAKTVNGPDQPASAGRGKSYPAADRGGLGRRQPSRRCQPRRRRGGADRAISRSPSVPWPSTCRCSG